MKFKAVLAAVMTFLGIEALAKVEGKSTLTEDQKKQLSEKYGDKFLASFLKDLEDYDREQATAAAADTQLAETRAALEALQAKYQKDMEAASAREENLNGLIEKLSAEPAADKTPAVPAQASKPSFTPDMGLSYNRALQEAFDKGDFNILATATIDTTSLRTEFGKYIDGFKRDIITTLFGQLQCTKYMTTKLTDKVEWQAIQNTLNNIVQRFTPYYTPSGQVQFKPLKITNRKHKINVPIKPAEIMEDVIGYLYDENLQPKDMPIVKYIIDVLLKPEIEQERDLMLGTGVYDSTKNANKTDGQAGDIGGSMDGFVTILRSLSQSATATTGIRRLLYSNGAYTTLTRSNIYAQFDNIYKEIPVKYRNKKMNIYIDPDLLNTYDLARDDKYDRSNENENEGKRRLHHTNFEFVPLDTMTGTNCFFITPKENFIHLLSSNANSTKLWAQADNYDVKIFGEWWEATGFAIAELVFAYAPAASSSGSGSSSSSSGSGSNSGSASA